MFIIVYKVILQYTEYFNHLINYTRSNNSPFALPILNLRMMMIPKYNALLFNTNTFLPTLIGEIRTLMWYSWVFYCILFWTFETYWSTKFKHALHNMGKKHLLVLCATIASILLLKIYNFSVSCIPPLICIRYLSFRIRFC